MPVRTRRSNRNDEGDGRGEEGSNGSTDAVSVELPSSVSVKSSPSQRIQQINQHIVSFQQQIAALENQKRQLQRLVQRDDDATLDNVSSELFFDARSTSSSSSSIASQPTITPVPVPRNRPPRRVYANPERIIIPSENNNNTATARGLDAQGQERMNRLGSRVWEGRRQAQSTVPCSRFGNRRS